MGRVIQALLLAPIAVVILLVNLYPYRPVTLFGWGMLLVLALPIVLAGEFFGKRVLGASFVRKLPPLVRITYGVVVIGVALAALMFAFPLLNGNLGKWGA